MIFRVNKFIYQICFYIMTFFRRFPKMGSPKSMNHLFLQDFPREILSWRGFLHHEVVKSWESLGLWSHIFRDVFADHEIRQDLMVHHTEQINGLAAFRSRLTLLAPLINRSITVDEVSSVQNSLSSFYTSWFRRDFMDCDNHQYTG